MRAFLVIAAVFSLAAGAANAQFEPIRPPTNPYALPQAPKPMGIPQPRTIGAPPARPPELFKPYKPYTGVNPDTAPSGLYPEQHPRKKHREPGALF